jgi:phosphopantetheinyl transferase
MIDFLVNRKNERFHLLIASIDKLCPEGISKRQKEALSSTKIINTSFPNHDLNHDEFGAPTLSNGKAISISHTNDYISILISNKLASIDIEPIGHKALKTATKFLNKKELELATSIEKATLFWSAKECLYKIHKKGGLTFTTDLRINSIEENQMECFIFDKSFMLNYEKYNDHWLVYYFD